MPRRRTSAITWSTVQDVFSRTFWAFERAQVESIKTSSSLELVCVDYWSAEKIGKCFFFFFSRTAKRAAQKLGDNYFCIYGFPPSLHSTSKESWLMGSRCCRELSSLPFHPGILENGSIEKFNYTLGNMLRVLPRSSKLKWPQMIQTRTFVINCTAPEITGCAAFISCLGTPGASQ